MLTNKDIWIICDIDGTISDQSHREHFAREKEWDQYHEQCELDPPILPILCIINGLSAKYSIAFITGRPEKYRDETVKWLGRHLVNLDYALHMRKEGDYRHDFTIKQEIFLEQFSDRKVLFALEDRNQVVNMWREEVGITCLQVAKGDF